MKKSLILIIPLLILLFPSFVRAESKSTTDITIEVNGQKKTFHAEGDENVDWTSDDGKSSVKINNSPNTQMEKNENTEQTQEMNQEKNGSESSNKATSSSVKNEIEEKLRMEAKNTKESLMELLNKEIARIKEIIVSSFQKAFHF